MAVLVVALPASAATDLARGLANLLTTPSSFITHTTLAANTAETITAPDLDSANGKVAVAFASDCQNFYYRAVIVNGVTVGGAATIPAADSTAGTSGFRNPTGFVMSEGDTLSLISGANCEVDAAWWKVKP